MSFFGDTLSPHCSACTAVCPGHGESYDDEQSCEFVGVGNMGVFDVKATGFGVGEETFNPPSLPVEAERIAGRRDICDDQNQFATFDLSPLKAQWIFRRAGHTGQPTRPLSLALLA